MSFDPRTFPDLKSALAHRVSLLEIVTSCEDPRSHSTFKGALTWAGLEVLQFEQIDELLKTVVLVPESFRGRAGVGYSGNEWVSFTDLYAEAWRGLARTMLRDREKDLSPAQHEVLHRTLVTGAP